MTLYALLLAVKLKVFAYMTPCLYVNKRFKMVRTAPQLPPPPVGNTPVVFLEGVDRSLGLWGSLCQVFLGPRRLQVL